jgi:hypothetical protein
MTQHGPPTTQRHTGIPLGAKHIARPHIAKTHIGRVDQIAAGVGKGAIQIKNNCFHNTLPFFGRNPAADVASRNLV